MINKSLKLFFSCLCFFIFFQSCSDNEKINNEVNSKSQDSSVTLRKQLSQTIDFIPWSEPVVFSETEISWSSFGSTQEELVFLGNPKRVYPSVLELGLLDDSATDQNILSEANNFFEKLKTGDINNCFMNSNFDSIKVLLESKKQSGPFERYICANPILLSDESFQIDCLFFSKEESFLAHLFLDKEGDDVKFQDFYFETLETK